MSLTTRISAFFLATLAVVLVGFSATLCLLARSHLLRDLDERLMATLDALAAAAEMGPGQVGWRPGTRLPLTEGHPLDVPVRWAVYDGAGHLLDHASNCARDDFAGALGMAPAAGHAHLLLVGDDGRAWRMAVRRVVPNAGSTARDVGVARNQKGVSPSLILATGTPMEPVETSLRRAAWFLAGLSTVLWVLAAATGRFLCRRALRPLTAMARAAGAMTAADHAQRLPSPGTRDELEHLAGSFNGLLDRLHEAVERQGRFSGDASHQLRTPLTALISEIEVARRRERATGEYQDVLDQIHGDAVRLRQIVEALLFLARADAESRCPLLEPIDLADWLPLHLRHWTGHPRGADIRLEAPAAMEDPFRALAHPPLLGQLLDNLLDNACKYTAPGTPITLRLGHEPGFVTVAVEDQGAGISGEDLPHLFEPFFRSAEARLRGQPGVGLGLAVADRIATTFGGRIAAASTPGQGSRFVVELPAAGSPEPAAAPSEMRSAPAAGAPGPVVDAALAR